MNKVVRVPTQIRCRWLDRRVAHTNMKKAGIRHINKHDYTTYRTFTGMTVQERLDSYFARHWRDTVNVPTIDLRRNTK